MFTWMISLSSAAEPSVTKLGMVMQHHGPKYNARRLVFCLQVRGHSEGCFNHFNQIWLLLLYLLNCQSVCNQIWMVHKKKASREAVNQFYLVLALLLRTEWHVKIVHILNLIPLSLHIRKHTHTHIHTQAEKDLTQLNVDVVSWPGQQLRFTSSSFIIMKIYHTPIIKELNLQWGCVQSERKIIWTV